MRVLLDTNVVSEGRRVAPDPRVQDRLKSIGAEDAFVSVVTLGEIAYGIRRLSSGQKRHDLERWLVTFESEYASRILQVDAETAHIWGDITAATESKGRTLRPQDGLIAATALRHGLHLWTRNTSDFEPTGVLLFNPWGE
jgi:predicted nucleic acid-binding protein